jgi:hypothetical protein
MRNSKIRFIVARLVRELVVQDAASYRPLFELAERVETIQAVKASLASADRGEGRPIDDVFNALEKDLGRAKTPP